MRLSSGILPALVSGAAAQNVVEFALHRGLPGMKFGAGPAVLKRDTYSQELTNNLTGGGYYTEVTVGTPPQTVNMILDTGSSDVWVISPDADLCKSARLQREHLDSCGATFDPDRSSTFELVQRNGFEITYVDGSVAGGDYISDDFTIGNVKITALQMGLATKTVRGTGIIGIGFSGNTVAAQEYPTIIDQLTEQGAVQVKAYSLYLNDRRSPTGSILFGGIDTAKFIGPMRILPILKDARARDYTHFQVALNSIQIEFSNGSSATVGTGQPTLFAAILDSGATLSYLPARMANQVFEVVGAITETRETGLTFIDCELLNDRDFVISFNFNGTVIVVPVWEMVLDVLGSYQDVLPRTIPWAHTCLFGIQATTLFQGSSKDVNLALLGDTFLRSAYVVYDLEHGQIGLAQANVNASDSNIVELTAGTTGLPSVTGVAKQQTTSTPTPTMANGGAGSGTGGGVATVTVTGQSRAPGSVRISGPGNGLVLVGITMAFALLGASLVAL